MEITFCDGSDIPRASAAFAIGCGAALAKGVPFFTRRASRSPALIVCVFWLLSVEFVLAFVERRRVMERRIYSPTFIARSA